MPSGNQPALRSIFRFDHLGNRQDGGNQSGGRSFPFPLVQKIVVSHFDEPPTIRQAVGLADLAFWTSRAAQVERRLIGTCLFEVSDALPHLRFTLRVSSNYARLKINGNNLSDAAS